LNGLCLAFLLLLDPKNLKKLLHQEKPEKPQLSLIEKLIENGIIEEVNGGVPDCLGDENL